MSVSDMALKGGSAAQGARHNAYRVALHADFAAARPIWAELWTSGHASPYQSIAFCELYFRHVEAPQGARLALIALHAPSGAPLMLLPLAIRGNRPMAVARFIGGKHSNFNMPLFSARGETQPGAAGLRAALSEAARIAGIDAYALHNQPVCWDGTPNPMAALSAMPSPSHAYGLRLGEPGDAVLQRQFSKDTRRKLKQKLKKLEVLGAVRYSRAETAAAAQQALDCFLRLKAERFAAQGIADPFAGDDVRAFLADASADQGATGRPLLEWHMLCVDDRTVALFAGLTSNSRFSALLTAFDADPEIARGSPGDILLNDMIRDAADRGFAALDLGVGEAHYKDKACDTTEALVESFIPASPAGHLLCAAMQAKQASKRAIKTSEAGQRAIALLRRLRAR